MRVRHRLDIELMMQRDGGVVQDLHIRCLDQELFPLGDVHRGQRLSQRGIESGIAVTATVERASPMPPSCVANLAYLSTILGSGVSQGPERR